MARYPEWFDRLDTVLELIRHADHLEWLGRKEIQAIFRCSERDAIRLLHKFGAEERDDLLSLPRQTLLTKLEAIRSGSTYAAFQRQRLGVATLLHKAHTEAATRQFAVQMPTSGSHRPSLQDLPTTIKWRRETTSGRFEIIYRDGSDLMQQIAEFLSAAGLDREKFWEGTEPTE